MLKVTEFNPTSNLKRSHRKEGNVYYGYSVVDCARMEVVATIRLYSTRSGGSNTACLWVTHTGRPGQTGVYASGSGVATGCGYHRPSAAAQGAFSSAGIKLSEGIDGRGDSAIREAMSALALHLKVKRAVIVDFNP